MCFDLSGFRLSQSLYAVTSRKTVVLRKCIIRRLTSRLNIKQYPCFRRFIMNRGRRLTSWSNTLHPRWYTDTYISRLTQHFWLSTLARVSAQSRREDLRVDLRRKEFNSAKRKRAKLSFLFFFYRYLRLTFFLSSLIQINRGPLAFWPRHAWQLLRNLIRRQLSVRRSCPRENR